MHEIFSRIITSADVNKAVEAAGREGMIDAGEAARMKTEISRLIESGAVRDWFEGGWRVITEQDILTPEGALKRPDRVMIKDGRAIVVDYKFGRQRSHSHQAQVRKYVDMLNEMKVGEVKGFLWYVNREEVVAV
jgi:CRISPR/Cas system-associated exonuclease Cas4 (RecB family)